MLKKSSFIFILVISIILTACGGSSTEGAVSYIGTITGAPETARVGIVVENNKFVAYIGSLDDSFNLSTSRWFSGLSEGDGTFAGTSADGVKINGSAYGNSFTGIITNLQGDKLIFRGSLVPSGSTAGIYRGVGEYDGQQVIVGAVVDEGDLFVAATVQLLDKAEFITPLIIPPFRVNDEKIILTFGDLSQKVDLFLVKSLVDLE